MELAERLDWDDIERRLRRSYKTPEQIRRFLDQLEATLPKPRLNKYLPPLNKNILEPYPKQQTFLLDDCMELFYGGAAGGGKSSSLLMGALQYCDVKDYSALLLRRTFAELQKPDALIDLSKKWLRGTDAVWSGWNRWFRFPSGAVLSFGYLESDNDKWQYQSAGYQYIGVDELTEWLLESTYRFMFSRLRKTVGMKVPLRMRSGSNPIGVGAPWVKQRFIVSTGSDGQTASEGTFKNEDGNSYVRKFMPAKLDDNIYLDSSYLNSLAALDPYLQQALRAGDWDVKPPGKMFMRTWFNKFICAVPEDAQYVRFWDLAATPETKGGDPSWTCGVKLGLHDSFFYLVDVRRERLSPYEVEKLVKLTAAQDGPYCEVVIEEEGGSAGKNVTDHYVRALPNRLVRGWHPTGPKEHRAALVARQVEAGNVIIVEGGSWLGVFLDEMEQFPPNTSRVKCDQVDAFSGAYIALTEHEAPNTSGIVMVGQRIRPEGLM